MDTPALTSEGLVRVIGTRALSLSIINLIIGAGIFALPGRIAALLGPSAILAYLICSVAVALVFLCFAEAGSRVSRSGGAYAYIEDAFGPWAGFVTSIMLWFGWGALANAAVALVLVDMLAWVDPVLGRPGPRSLVIIALFGGFAVINVLGVRAGVRYMVVNTWVKLVPLIVLVVVGAFAVDWSNLAIIEMPSVANLGTGTLLLVFAFGGAEIALNASGEITNPRRTVPMGLLFGIGVVFILYLAIQSVAQGVLGPELATNVEAPLVATAERAMGPWGRTFLLIGAGLSILGVTSGHILSTPRAIFAAARDGLLPSKLAAVHPRFRTPHWAIIFYCVVACGFALSGTFKTLAVISSGSVLLIYLGCSLAVLKLRQMGKGDGGLGGDAGAEGVPVDGGLGGDSGTGAPGDQARDAMDDSAPTFRIPGGPLVPILSSIVILWMLSNMTRAEATGLGILVAVSSAAYFIRRAVLGRARTRT